MERRLSPRTTAHDVVTARVRPGRQVSVIDLSASGALIETSHRLLPGTSVELHVEGTDRSATVRGRVLRCAVSQVRSSSVSYRGAIAFDLHLPWFVNEEESGYGVHTSEKRSGHTFRADATPQLL
jgi:ABC-type iron transport system FetAB ATPase subunit